MTLLLCPLELELTALLAAIRAQGFEIQQEEVGRQNCFRVDSLCLIVSLAGHGKTQFGIHTQYLMDRIPNLDLVVCAGCAGGLQSPVRVFDVVIATQTIEHDYRLRFARRPDPSFKGSEKAIESIKNFAISKFSIHFGAVASGDEDIIESLRANELVVQTNALAVAWEGAGGARAAKFNEVPFLEIRGITDTSDGEAPTDFETNLEVAMSNVGEIVLRLTEQNLETR